MRRLAALAALAAPAAALPTLVYVVGVEGSGHHGAMLQLVWPLVRDRCGRACPPPRSRADLDDDGADAVYARASRCASYAHDAAVARAGKESEIPNFKGSYLGRFPLVSADFWTSDHLSERSRRVDAFSGTRARGTLMLKRT